MRSALVTNLEQISSQMWVAKEIHDLGGWQLRLNDDVTWRANSILPISSPGLELNEAIAYCTDYYSSRGLHPRFQLTQYSYPKELDAELERRDWKVGISVETQTIDIENYTRNEKNVHYSF